MSRKPQNPIEIVLLLGVLLLVTISIFTIYNNGQTKSAQLSTIKATGGQGVVDPADTRHSKDNGAN